jgi:CRP-like cAMP-binding protein
MQPSPDMLTGNYLLDALPPRSLGLLWPHLESVALVINDTVRTVEHVYFPIAGLISMVVTMADGAVVEIGMVGREGMYSVSAILSENTPLQKAMVQLPGRALQMKKHLLREGMQADCVLQRLLLRYADATLNAVVQSAACNRLHLLEQRCARWLLACRDRADADKFAITHQFLAMMLGVRRPGVTVVARSLQKHGLISYYHGTMTVIDRVALEAAACECYRVIRDEFDRLRAA